MVSMQKLVESFEVDNGSLDGLSLQKCFVLGTEWERFHRKLQLRTPFAELVHKENVNRLVRMAENHRRFVEHSAIECGWVKIVVGDQID
jgi:hypothetical protein